MDINKYILDERKARRGVWIEHDGARFLVASMQGNPDYIRAIGELAKKADKHKMSLDMQGDELTRIMAKHILLDWQGVTSGGDEIAYSPDEAFSLMKQAPGFREMIAAWADDQDKFLADREREVKNG